MIFAPRDGKFIEEFESGKTPIRSLSKAIEANQLVIEPRHSSTSLKKKKKKKEEEEEEKEEETLGPSLVFHFTRRSPTDHLHNVGNGSTFLIISSSGGKFLLPSRRAASAGRCTFVENVVCRTGAKSGTGDRPSLIGKLDRRRLSPVSTRVDWCPVNLQFANVDIDHLLPIHCGHPILERRV